MDMKKHYLYAEYPHGVYFFSFAVIPRTPIGCIVSGFAFPHFSPYIPCYISPSLLFRLLHPTRSPRVAPS